MSHSASTRETRAGACELKFLVDRALGVRVRDWARAHLPPDPHGAGLFRDEYNVSSLYFDTERHDVFYGRGSFGRSKYRVRRYGRSDLIFLERKLRKPGLLHKRRTLTGIDELQRLTADPEHAWPGHWFHRRLLARRLRPVCSLAYSRVARVAERQSGAIRLTIDDGICVRGIDDLTFDSGAALPVLEQQMVVEVKFRGDLPGVFKELIETFTLVPTPSSKYRLGMVALGHIPALKSPAELAVRTGAGRLHGLQSVTLHRVDEQEV
jgi:hypothetical protein